MTTRATAINVESGVDSTKMSVPPALLAVLILSYDSWVGSKRPEEQEEYLEVMQSLRDRLAKEGYIDVKTF